MAVKLENKTNVTAPSVAFPFGDVKDNTGANNGTPVNRATVGDFHQFFAKLLDASGIVANGLPDNFTNGFQYYNALLAVIGSNNAWVAVTLTNGWTGSVFYRKELNGRVSIKGWLNNASASDSPAFTLPVGFRPLAESAFPTIDANQLTPANGQGVRVLTTGVFIAPTTVSHSLDSVSFFID